MRELIEQENCYLENLNYRISIKYRYYKKIPSFQEQIKECDKTLMKISAKFESVRRRESFKTVVRELHGLIDKHNDSS